MNKNTWIIGFTLFAMFFGAETLFFQQISVSIVDISYGRLYLHLL